MTYFQMTIWYIDMMTKTLKRNTDFLLIVSYYWEDIFQTRTQLTPTLTITFTYLLAYLYHCVVSYGNNEAAPEVFDKSLSEPIN